MYPGTIIFLPVLYMPYKYDSTQVFLSLIKNDGINNNELEITSLGYNFALLKRSDYAQEDE